MSRCFFGRACAALAGLLFISGGIASAAQLRYHYAPTDLCGNTSLKPGGRCGSAGTRVSWFGLVREDYNCPPQANHMVSFRHPYTGGIVNVPLAFPEGTPRIEYRSTRIIYNYGSYAVEAHFLPDGSVDAVYNNGFFRVF